MLDIDYTPLYDRPSNRPAQPLLEILCRQRLLAQENWQKEYIHP